MITLMVDIFLGALAFYLLLGLIFSVYFYLKGAAQIDKGTQQTPWHFKVIIFPGIVLFWSLLLAKQLKNR